MKKQFSLPVPEKPIGRVVLKNKMLLFYYLPELQSVYVFLKAGKQPKIQNYLPVFSSLNTFEPIKIRRSKDVIRFYYVETGKVAIVKFSLKELLGQLYRQSKVAGTLQKPKTVNFKRVGENPILGPIEANKWESSAVFNAGAVFLNNTVHFIYRAIGHSGSSVFGYASSKDGVHITERLATPVFVSPKFNQEKESSFSAFTYGSGGSWWGCEDPRLTLIEDAVYMTYTAFNGVHPPCVALTSITVDDFLAKNWNWKTPKIISEPGKMNKNWVVFPEKINRKYAVLHSLTPKIAIDYRDTLDFKNNDFITSNYHKKGREKSWDNWMRGVGAPPLKTKDGWLVLYHAMDKKDPNKYKIGALILDEKNPEKILYRSGTPLLEPNAWYENDGHKKGVVYNCGAVVLNANLMVYYGSSDTFTCAATANLNSLLSQLKSPSTQKTPKIVSI